MEQTGKIGLIIGIISAGEEKLHTSEAAKQWERYYVDPRNYLKKLNIAEDSVSTGASFIDFICYGDNVALLFINKSIAGRPGDGVVAMITVPTDINISGEQLEYIISETKNELTKTRIDPAYLDKLYGKEYTVIKKSHVCNNSYNNEQYALQKYGKSVNYHLYELLDKNLFSSCYNSYKAVFLINDEDEIIPSDDVVILEQEQIDQYAILKYPTRCEFNLKINNKDFISDFPTVYGRVVEIDAFRQGYLPERIAVCIDSMYVDPTKQLNSIIWKYQFDIKQFVVFDVENQKEVSDKKIFINDIEILNNTPFPEKDLKGAIVTIKSQGYVDKRLKFADINNIWHRHDFKACIAKLERVPKTYNYIIIDSTLNQSDVKFHIEDAKFDINESPLEMYEVYRHGLSNNEETIYLRKKSRFGKRELYIALITFLTLIGLGCWCGWALNSALNQPTTEETVPSEDIKDVFISLRNKKFKALLDKYPYLNDNPDFDNVVKQLSYTQKENGAAQETSGTSEDLAVNDISILLDNSIWIMKEFENAGYLELYNAVNSYDYEAIIACYEKLKTNNIGIKNGTKYQTWNQVVSLCKSDNKNILDGTFTANGSTKIDLTDWKRKVTKTSPNNVVKDLLRKNKWIRDDFQNAGYESLFNDLLSFRFDRISTYQDLFGNTTKERLNNVVKWQKENPGKSLNIAPAYAEDCDEIVVWEWRQKIDNALQSNRKIGGLS